MPDQGQLLLLLGMLVHFVLVVCPIPNLNAHTVINIIFNFLLPSNMISMMFFNMAVYEACIFNWIWHGHGKKSSQQVQIKLTGRNRLGSSKILRSYIFRLYRCSFMSLPIIYSHLAFCSIYVLTWYVLSYILSSASLSLLPWPKPAVWPTVPPDASSEVLEKEKASSLFVCVFSFFFLDSFFVVFLFSSRESKTRKEC